MRGTCTKHGAYDGAACPVCWDAAQTLNQAAARLGNAAWEMTEAEKASNKVDDLIHGKAHRHHLKVEFDKAYAALTVLKAAEK